MRYTQSKFSRDFKVDERYKGTNNKSRTNPGERPKQIDDRAGLAFLKNFSRGINFRGEKFSNGLDFRPGSSTDNEFPPRVDNKELYNASNLLDKSDNYFA